MSYAIELVNEELTKRKRKYENKITTLAELLGGEELSVEEITRRLIGVYKEANQAVKPKLEKLGVKEILPVLEPSIVERYKSSKFEGEPYRLRLIPITAYTIKFKTGFLKRVDIESSDTVVKVTEILNRHYPCITEIKDPETGEVVKRTILSHRVSRSRERARRCIKVRVESPHIGIIYLFSDSMVVYVLNPEQSPLRIPLGDERSRALIDELADLYGYTTQVIEEKESKK